MPKKPNFRVPPVGQGTITAKSACFATVPFLQRFKRHLPASPAAELYSLRQSFSESLGHFELDAEHAPRAIWVRKELQQGRTSIK